ncbi:hypothetical protein Tco_1484647 [Tanacetum coccineum]
MIRMLQGIDKEDLETLWKLVKEKHGINRPIEDYERVLSGDLKVMFEPDIKSDVWRNLQGYKLQMLSDYYCWKDYADREGIKIDWRTRILTKISEITTSKSFNDFLIQKAVRNRDLLALIQQEGRDGQYAIINRYSYNINGSLIKEPLRDAGDAS